MATDETLSLQLYDFLCEAVGSEKTVSARRLWYSCAADISNALLKDDPTILPVIASGSRAEGLNFNGSDLDVMFVLRTMVYNHTQTSSNSHSLCYDMETSQPGFCKIKICPNKVTKDQFNVFRNFGPCRNIFRESTVFTESGMVISSDKFKQYLLHNSVGYINSEFIYKLHGPCLAAFDDSLDVAFTLKCPFWPSEASTWITRDRLSGWPTSDKMSEIVNAGVLFVPIGPSSEWRLSFSLGEKLLIHSFNHTQLLCYALLKYVLKEVINDIPVLQDLLCSYFLKTVVFWVSEENDVKSWIPQRLLPCFQECLKRLIYFVQCGYCPNYFMPDNNMFKNKIYGKYQRKLYSFLDDLYNGGMLYVVLCCRSLYGFHNNITSMPSLKEIDRGLYPLISYSCLWDTTINKIRIDSNYALTLNSLSNVLKRLCFVKNDVPKLAIHLYFINLAFYIGTIGTNSYTHSMRNRQLYIAYRRWLSHLLIGTARDNVRGWLYIAMFFYCYRQLDRALIITNFVLSECTCEKLYLNEDDMYTPSPLYDKVKHLPFTKRLKMTCVYDYMCIDTKVQWPLFKEQYDDHMIDKTSIMNIVKWFNRSIFEDLPCVVYPTVTSVFCHYIHFLCHHHLKHLEESHRSLYQLKDAIEKYKQTSCTTVLMSTCMALDHAVKMSDSDIDINKTFFEICMKCYKENQFQQFFHHLLRDC